MGGDECGVIDKVSEIDDLVIIIATLCLLEHMFHDRVVRVELQDIRLGRHVRESIRACKCLRLHHDLHAPQVFVLVGPHEAHRRYQVRREVRT